MFAKPALVSVPYIGRMTRSDVDRSEKCESSPIACRGGGAKSQWYTTHSTLVTYLWNNVRHEAILHEPSSLFSCSCTTSVLFLIGLDL